MSVLSQDNLITALKASSLLTLGTYAGSTAAIACPVALGVENLEKATCRAKVLRSILKNSLFFPATAALAQVTAVSAYIATRGTDREDLSLLVGAGAAFILFPYTFVFLKPINDRLVKETEISEEDAAPLVRRWFQLHSVRSALSLAAFGYVAYKAVCK